MITEGKAGFIILVLEPHDWKRGGKEFIKEMKDSIPPDDREWNDELKQWFIKGKWKYVLRSMIEKYFTDKNQMGLEF